MNFVLFTTSELISYVKTFRWSRNINQLHIHHTWKPEHSDYTGKNGPTLQIGMRNYHVNTNRWKDIGQHLTLLPDGQWVTGRDFNADPASIQDWNKGAFSIEMLGNFDKGYNIFEGLQAEAMFEFCAFFITWMKLDIVADLKFHRDNPSVHKTCPGSSIDRLWFINELSFKIQSLLLKSKDKSAYKLEVVDKLARAGFINEPQMWKDKIDEPMPVWAVLTVVNSVYENFSAKK